jgi:DNA invertase Pin-like site-specific DNA recombinase
MYVSGFYKKRDELVRLVEKFEKGDTIAQLRLRELLTNDLYMQVFLATFKETAQERALQPLKASSGSIDIMRGPPMQGGAPGLRNRR